MVRGSSGSHSFDDAERTLRCHDAHQLQSGLFEDSGKLLLRALSSSNNEHLNVHELAPTRVVAGRDDVIHDQDPPFLIHGGAAVREDFHALLIIPVVENVFHDVSIATGRHGLEEASRF